jgi:hypothetical protein
MKKLLFLFILCLSNAVNAQSALDRGRPAPEDGVFYTNRQAAQLLVERETVELRCNASVEVEKKKLLAIQEGEKQKSNTILQAEKDKCKMLLDLKDQQINDLIANLEKQEDDHSSWWFVGGVTVGTVGSLFVFFAATQLQGAPNLLGGQ